MPCNSIEKERGITIFSKQAELNEKITLIDTPGHVDFAAEMERTLSVLDAAILLINASDGIQSHTKTLWSLLNQYKIPTVIFVNKMDMPDTNKNNLLSKLKSGLSEKICEFKKENLENFDDSFLEEISSHDDTLTEKYLNGETITREDISRAISDRNLFPCIFGSALKLQNVDLILDVLNDYFAFPECSPDQNDFGCIVYKISKDKQNNRLTHLKVTGGTLRVKDNLEEELPEIMVEYSENTKEIRVRLNITQKFTFSSPLYHVVQE